MDVSDHYSVHAKLVYQKPKPVKKSVSYRKIKQIDLSGFVEDIKNSGFQLNGTESIHLADEKYNEITADALNKHAPLKTLSIVLRPKKPWFSEEIRCEKRLRRKLEKKWRKSRLTIDLEIYKTQCNKVTHMCERAKSAYFMDLVEENKGF